MNLAAAADKIRFDLFVTYTCSQSNPPGTCHQCNSKMNDNLDEDEPPFLPNGLPSDPSRLVFKGRSRSLSPGYTYVKLRELEEEDDDDSSLISKVLVLLVLYYKKAKVDNRKGLYSRVSQSSQEVNYDRTLTLMDPNSPPGLNCCVVLLDSRRSDLVFGQHLIARDEKDGFGPGSMIAIIRPKRIENVFGNQDGIPVLQPQSGFKLVDVARSNITLAQIPRSKHSKRLHAYYYPRVKITLQNCQVAATCCCGNLCDGLNLKKPDGSWHVACPCYKSQRSLGNLLLDVDLKVQVINDDGTAVPKEEDGVFISKDFASRSFTSLVTLTGFQNGVNMQLLEHIGADHEIIHRLDVLFSQVNANGGFNILAWSRKGHNDDQAYDKLSGKPGGPNGGEGKVTSSNAKVHLTKVLFNHEKSYFSDFVVDCDTIIAEHMQEG